MKSVHPMAWAIIVGTLFGRLATSMSMPFLGIYLSVVKDESPFVVGVIIAASSLTSVIGGFFGGNLSDQFGRKRLMLISVFAWAAVFFGFAAAEETYQFLLLSLANGICRSCFEPPSRALISEVTKPENKLLLFNLRYTAANIGVAVGPIVGFLLGTGDSLTTFNLAGIVYVLYGIILVYLFRKTNIQQTVSTKRTSIKAALNVIKTDKIFMFFIIAFILTSFGYSQMTGTLPQFFGGVPTIENGTELFAILLTINAISVIIMQYPILHIAKRFHPIYATLTGTVILAIGLIGFGLLQNIWLLYLCMILFSAGEVLMTTMSDYFIDTIAPTHLRGSYFGAMAFAGIGSIIGPVAGGVFISYFGHGEGDIIFSLLACITLLGVPLYLRGSALVKRNKQYQLIEKM